MPASLAAPAGEGTGAVAVGAQPMATGSATSGLRTLRAGGVRIRAPRGYSLVVRNGASRLSGPTAQMSLVAIRSTDSVRAVAEGLLGVTLSSYPEGDALSVRFPLKRGATGNAYFQRVPGGVSVIVVTPRGGRKAVRASVRRTLAKAAATARGISLRMLPKTTTKTQESPLPLKAFQTSDGSAKALVPDADGWTAGGQQGIVEGGHPQFGGFAFGVFVPFSEPTAFCLNPCPLLLVPFMSAGQAVEQAWPVFLARSGFQVSGVRVVSQVPGSEGVLGQGIDSGIYQFAGQLGGLDAVGYISAGTARVSQESWGLYYSFVAAAKGASGAVGDAMLKAWQSWDPSADQARRQRQTFITRQETTEIIQQTTEYRRRVFEATNYNWNQLISGSNPVLGLVDRNVIGDGGETLVRAPDGNLFDLEGNQFRTPG